LVQISLDGTWGTKDKYILNFNFQKQFLEKSRTYDNCLS